MKNNIVFFFENGGKPSVLGFSTFSSLVFSKIAWRIFFKFFHFSRTQYYWLHRKNCMSVRIYIPGVDQYLDPRGSLICLSLHILLILSKTLNEGRFGSCKLVGHGHFGGYDNLLFDCLRILIDIKGWITDYAWLVLKDQRNRNWSIEHSFN